MRGSEPRTPGCACRCWSLRSPPGAAGIFGVLMGGRAGVSLGERHCRRLLSLDVWRFLTPFETDDTCFKSPRSCRLGITCLRHASCQLKCGQLMEPDLLGWETVSRKITALAEGGDIAPDVSKLADTFVLMATGRLMGSSEVTVNSYRRHLCIQWHEITPALELEIEGGDGFTLHQFPQREAQA